MGIFNAHFSLGQNSLTGLPFVKSFRNQDYKAGIQNWGIVQGKNGLVYVANNHGLLEFDGVSWKAYGVKNGTKVRSLAIDKKGKIFVGCQSDFGYFFPNRSGQLVYTSLADSLQPEQRNFDDTWNVFIENDRVYFCTAAKIFIYEKKRIDVIESPFKINLSFYIKGKLYLFCQNVGLSVLEEKVIKPLPKGIFFASNNISSIVPYPNNQLIISTFQKGVFRFTEDKVLAWFEQLQPELIAANVNCMLQLHNGNFAIGTQNKGLIIVSPKGEIIFDLTLGRGLSSRTILCIYEDNQNNLWLGQNNGLSMVEMSSPFTFINEEIGLPGTGYSAFKSDDRLYLGTNTGLYSKSVNLADNFVPVKNTSGQVYHIGQYNGQLLMGHHNGAYEIKDNEAMRISPTQGSWIFAVLNKKTSKLLEGTYTGLQLYSKSSKGWKFEKKLDGFNESSRVMAEGDNGSVWVTHVYKGAFKIKLNENADSILQVSYYGVNKGFPTSKLINVFKVNGDLLFTSEYGVFRYQLETDSFVHDNLFTKLFGRDVQIWYIQEDAIGNIYFVGKEKIGLLRKTGSDTYELEGSSLNRLRGFLNDDLHSITILDNNEVLFGAKDGFIQFNPKVNNERKISFKTHIRSVATTHSRDSLFFFGNYFRNDSIVEVQPMEERPSLSYQNNSLDFTYAATLYQDGVEYQYYLYPFEKTWSDWSAQTQKEYTNLKENKYAFHVRAKSINGDISPEVLYEFVIRPPWYRSIYAYILYGAAGIGLFSVAFYSLDKKYQKAQKMMALKQKKELNRKQIEIKEIVNQSQEEIMRLRQEKLESELSHKNNELATSTMHLLNKNEFISGIKKEIGEIITISSTDQLKKQLEQISKSIESHMSSDADWEKFLFHFDRVHGDFSKRLKNQFPSLSNQELKLSAYLRMNLSTKEMAQLLNISIRGVEISRYRLRKKLQLDRNKNLQEFILNF
ncbi:MAG TPA: two component regulator three y domain-containing protein [Cytophagales bacterium]|nr:two component regulator three y domain-containing protein [Cytophagales bacterium]